MAPICKINKDLSGQIVLITGANTGIGRECAQHLASFGAKIILACRSKEKTEPVVQQINKQYPKSQSEFMQLDLSDLNSVKTFCDNFKQKFNKIDILLNNAGVMLIQQRQLTKQGHEMQLGTNHFGHFVLTNNLLPLIKNTPNSRIINVSSMAHDVFFKKHGDIHFNDLTLKNYDPATAYAQSKLANILFTKKLSRNLKTSNPDIKVVCLHPGVVRTELSRHIMEQANCCKKLFIKIFYSFQLSVKEGAQTNLQCCLEDNNKLIDGAYYDKLKVGKSSEKSQDQVLQDQFWDISNQLVKPYLIGW